MRSLWLAVRSALLWLVSALHFFIVAPLIVLFAVFFDPRKNDWLQRSFSRHILLFIGAKLQVRIARGFDPRKTSFFMVNHVNLFDPFVLYCALPQYVRGWELESHFKIPAYGLLMRRLGNVPVPDVRTPSDLRRMWRLTREAIDGGTSLIVFPEAKRTRDGSLGEFQDGGFRVAQKLGVPIVPVTLTGSFDLHKTGEWMLRPATITVHIHDTIATEGLTRQDVPALRDRVRAIIAAPLHGSPENQMKVEL